MFTIFYTLQLYVYNILHTATICLQYFTYWNYMFKYFTDCNYMFTIFYVLQLYVYNILHYNITFPLDCNSYYVTVL